MKQSTRKKTWRINVILTYFGEDIAYLHRYNLIELLKHLAAIYSLDYAIAIEYEAPIDEDWEDMEDLEDDVHIFDLIYFRANKNTRIEKKEFRKIIDCMFDKVPSMFHDGAYVSAQLYSALNEFPFPSEFYRPLEYPFIEHHQDSQTTMEYQNILERTFAERDIKQIADLN